VPSNEKYSRNGIVSGEVHPSWPTGNKPRVSQQVPTHDSLPEKEDAIEIEGASETRKTRMR